MRLSCAHCKQEFDASRDQEQFIAESGKKGMDFIRIGCPSCGRNFDLNPMTGQPGSRKSKPAAKALRCPVQTCAGVVSHVDDDPAFWGCGECGNAWFNLSDLDQAIDGIIKKFPYRKALYVQKDGHYLPAPGSKTPKNYAELVRSEWGQSS
jgi:hypothetical protein